MVGSTSIQVAAAEVQKQALQILHLLCSMEDAIQKLGLLCEGSELEDCSAELLERIIVLGRIAKAAAREVEEHGERIESQAPLAFAAQLAVRPPRTNGGH